MDGFFPKPINLTVLRQLIDQKRKKTSFSNICHEADTMDLPGVRMEQNNPKMSKGFAMGAVTAKAAAAAASAAASAAAATVPSDMKRGISHAEEVSLLRAADEDERTEDAPRVRCRLYIDL